MTRVASGRGVDRRRALDRGVRATVFLAPLGAVSPPVDLVAVFARWDPPADVPGWRTESGVTRGALRLVTTAP